MKHQCPFFPPCHDAGNTSGFRGEIAGMRRTSRKARGIIRKTSDGEASQNRTVISNRFTTDLWERRAQEDKNNLRLNKIVPFSIGINKKKNVALKSVACTAAAAAICILLYDVIRFYNLILSP